jgi:hypothetical protein
MCQLKAPAALVADVDAEAGELPRLRLEVEGGFTVEVYPGRVVEGRCLGGLKCDRSRRGGGLSSGAPYFAYRRPVP